MTPLIVPTALRESVRRDLRPVRPLAAPWVRALLVVPLALAALVAVPLIFGLRPDAGVLGGGLSWGISIGQVALGLGLIVLALRESIPGRALSPASFVVALGAASGAVVAVTWLTYTASPTVAPPARAARYFLICFRDSSMVGVPVVALAAVLAARAWPLKPAIAGALYGAGGGVIADAAWRLFCEVSEPSHVLAAHGLAILTLTLSGSIAACAIEWLRGRWFA
jgi:hypothetical protein